MFVKKQGLAGESGILPEKPHTLICKYGGKQMVTGGRPVPQLVARNCNLSTCFAQESAPFRNIPFLRRRLAKLDRALNRFSCHTDDLKLTKLKGRRILHFFSPDHYVEFLGSVPFDSL